MLVDLLLRHVTGGYSVTFVWLLGIGNTERLSKLLVGVRMHQTPNMSKFVERARRLGVRSQRNVIVLIIFKILRFEMIESCVVH